MTKIIKVAEALVTDGYLTEADLEVATKILADVLIVEAAEEDEAAAMDDYSDQEDLIAKAEVWEAEDVFAGDFDGTDQDADIITDAKTQKEFDKEVVKESEAMIATAYQDAAAALVTAELIDDVNLTPVAAVIADVWTSEQV